ncbi:MAG: hypothetical protein FJ319_07885 [SAR202 cluster bacterium]|nr:hypothetical protein [SAR202 cluster bacterium]
MATSFNLSHRVAVLLPAISALFVITLLSTACTPDADPFRPRATATPDPASTVATSGGPTTAEDLSVLNRNPELLGKGTIRFSNSGVNTTSFGSTLAGYIVVWGYGYSAELVDTKESGFKQAVEAGLVDVVIEALETDEADWYNAQTSAGKMFDVGSLYGPTSDKRIMVTAAFKNSAPDLTEFLQKLSVGEEGITTITAGITGGRTGITPAVATLQYLKTNEETWAG